VAGAAGCDGTESNGDVPNGEPIQPDLSSGLGSIVSCDDNPGEGLEAGEQALDFRFKDAVGTTFSLSDYRGRAVLVNFWSIGCSHCVEEIPYIQQVYEEWPPEELVVLTVEVFNDTEAVNAFLADSGVSLPVLLDSALELKGQYGVDKIPRTFFIDKEGWIRGIKFGNFEGLEELEDILEQLITLQEGG
jgi:peroxiredoxin